MVRCPKSTVQLLMRFIINNSAILWLAKRIDDGALQPIPLTSTSILDKAPGLLSPLLFLLFRRLSHSVCFPLPFFLSLLSPLYVLLYLTFSPYSCNLSTFQTCLCPLKHLDQQVANVTLPAKNVCVCVKGKTGGMEVTNVSVPMNLGRFFFFPRNVRIDRPPDQPHKSHKESWVQE